MASRNLQLDVMLRAIDRATRPLRQITQGSDATARALKGSRDQLRELENAQRNLRGFRTLKQQSERTATALDAQQRRVRELTQQIQRAEGPTRQLNRQRDAAIRNARQLKQQYQGEQRELQQLRSRMGNVEGVTGRYSEQQRELSRRIGEANRQLERQQQRLTETARRQRAAAEAARRHQRAMGNIGRMQGVGAGMLGTGLAQGWATARTLAPGVAWAEQMSTLQAVGRFGADDERYQALRAQSRELGGSTAFSATEVGAGQEFLLRAGMSAEAIQASMRDVLDLALANNTELGRAADIASNIAGTFKVDMEAEGAMARVADILSGTASRANVDLEMLGNTMKYLGGAEDLELTMEQAAAMAGMLGNIGIQGSQAGTTMRAMMNRLTNPADKGAAAIQNIGLQVADANGNMRAMPDILRDISEATAELGNVERKAILQDIFGAEAGSGMAELVNSMADGQMDEIISALGENYGENARMAATMADNIGGDLKNLKSAWEEIGISIADTNDGPMRDLVQTVTWITRGVGDWIKANPELAGTIAKVAGALMIIVTAGGALTMMLASVLGPIAMVRYALTLLSLNPVSLTIMAIVAACAALAGAAYLVYQHWDSISAWFGDLWNGVKEAFAGGIGGVTQLLVNWSPLGLLWRGISAALGTLGIELPTTLIDLGGAIVDGMVSGITGALGRLREAVVGMGGSVIGWFKETLGINSPSRVFAGFGGDLMQGLVNGIDENWNALKEAIGGTADAVTNWFKEKLGINSPSRVFAEFGGYTMEGYQQGLARGERGPLREVDTFARRLRQAGAGLALGAAAGAAVAGGHGIAIDSRPPLASAGSGLQVSIGEINVHAAPGMDEQALARLVAAEVQRALREAERDARTRSRSALYDTD